jgi:hypothetical protein
MSSSRIADNSTGPASTRSPKRRHRPSLLINRRGPQPGIAPETRACISRLREAFTVAVMTEIRIAELAASTAVTVRTLRYCKELELLMPDRSTGGNRLPRCSRSRSRPYLRMVIVGSPPRSRLAARPSEPRCESARNQRHSGRRRCRTGRSVCRLSRHEMLFGRYSGRRTSTSAEHVHLLTIHGERGAGWLWIDLCGTPLIPSDARGHTTCLILPCLIASPRAVET